MLLIETRDSEEEEKREEENSRDHSAVGTELGLVKSILAVLPHQVVRVRPVRLVLGHKVNTHLPFSAVIQDLWRSRRSLVFTAIFTHSWPG